jgi:hypothetical protein
VKRPGYRGMDVFEHVRAHRLQEGASRWMFCMRS